MTTTSPSRTCPGCRSRVDRGLWHPDCLRVYRASEDYRTAALHRDGHNCARCWSGWNRLLVAHFTWRRRQPWYVRTLLPWPRPDKLGNRPVDVDHILPLALGGTHDPDNLQVLCKRHHRTKTRRDRAQMRGEAPPSHRRVLGTAGACGTAAVGYLFGRHHWPVLAACLLFAVLPLAGLVVLHHRRGRVLARLHTSVSKVTGAPAGPLVAAEQRRGRRGPHLKPGPELLAHARAHIRVRRWKGRTPIDFTVRYPYTFADSDPNAREQVESRVAAKLGATFAAAWDTAADGVRFVSPDPLADPVPLRWPLADASSPSLWDPIPVAVDEAGAPVTIQLPERNLLLGGEPGAGKSNALSMPLAVAALDPEVTLFLLDGKQVEFPDWAPVAEEVVLGANLPRAVELLSTVRLEMEARYATLLAKGARKVTRDMGMGLIVLAIDELASFTVADGSDRKARDQFVAILRDIIQRGRAAGVIVIAATQRPSADVIPTSIRDLFGFRWALRCNTYRSSDMILGEWASEGFSAHRIPSGQRGVGYLLHEGDRPVRCRGYYLDDPTISGLARLARMNRS